ncbi:hypothetical protein PCE1_004975 [Barthelona sp. PCE]
MNGAQIQIELEKKAEAVIANRRRLLEERRQRILDDKTRQIGLDVDFLQQQVEERKQREAKEAMEDRALDELLLSNEQKILKIQRDIDRERRRVNAELENFRMQDQKKENRLDYDLYDPEALKKEKPLPESELGPASMQIFAGEDRGKAEREALQREQQKQWCEEQIAIKNAKAEAERIQNANYDAFVLSLDEQMKRLTGTFNSLQKEALNNVLNENASLADMRKYKEAEEKRQSDLQKKQELEAINTSPFFMEDASRQLNENNRYVTYEFKGFSKENLNEIRQVQLRQIEEKRQRDEAERNVEARHAQEEQRIRNELTKMDRLRKRQLLDEKRKLQNTLKEQDDMFKTTQKVNNEVVAKTAVDPSFFDAFGQSAR